MYSRSLDPRRVPSSLPSHYSGNAFRSDGTPTPIPVKREHDVTWHTRTERGDPQEDMGKRPFPSRPESGQERPPHDDRDEPTLDERDGLPPDEQDAPSTHTQESECPEAPSAKEDAPRNAADAPFLSRLLGGMFPEIREDDLLLLLLLLLLSREKGNEDALLPLAFLLLSS